MTRGMEKRLAVAAAAVIVAAVVPAHAQLAKDSTVVGLSLVSGTYRVSVNGLWSQGPGWAPAFVQSVEFDNAGMISHNARGNLFGCNFGNSYTGFEIYNLATDGTSNSSSAWSIVQATGGTRGTNPSGAWLSERGGGLSVSPNNSYVAWVDTDKGCLFVHNYLPGSNPGSGLAGPVISGARQTPDGSVGTGTTPTKSMGTCWLNDWTVICLDTAGYIEKLDLRTHPVGGTENGTMAGWAPEQIPAADFPWVNSDVWTYESGRNGKFDPQFMDVEYNAEVNPNLIVGSVTRYPVNSTDPLSPYTYSLYAFDYNPATGAISLNRVLDIPQVNGQSIEPREIAFDSQGNLLIGSYVGGGSDYVVARFVGASNLTNWANPVFEPVYDRVAGLEPTLFVRYDGMDVGASIVMTQKLGDADNNRKVDTSDLTVVTQNWDPTGTTFHAFWQGDFDRSGQVDSYDLAAVLQNWSPTGY